MKLATSDKVLILNCDDITDINPSDLENLLENQICAAHPQLPFGLIKEEGGYVVFAENQSFQAG